MSGAFLRGRAFVEHTVGQNFIRDTEHPCEFFQLTPYGSGDGKCEGDGHYMCMECTEHVKAPTFDD